MVAAVVRLVNDCAVPAATILAQTVTAIVATAALIVSIISLVLQRRDRRPRLKITGSLSTFMDHNFNAGEHVYMLNVANKGATPVTVTQLYIWYSRSWKFAFPEIRGDRPLPCKLDPEDGARWWVGYEALREALRRSGLKGKVRIKIEATDATGGSHATRTRIVLNSPWWLRGWRRLFGNRSGS